MKPHLGLIQFIATASVGALFDDYKDMVHRENIGAMRLIGAAGRISEATGSHDFIW
jgi:hypothetical protein